MSNCVRALQNNVFQPNFRPALHVVSVIQHALKQLQLTNHGWMSCDYWSTCFRKSMQTKKIDAAHVVELAIGNAAQMFRF